MMKTALTLLILLTVFSMPPSASAQTREETEKKELERKRKQIQQEIEQLQKQQGLISKDKKAGLGQLKIIQSKLQKRYAVIDNINDEVRLIDNKIFGNNREIYRLQKQLDTLRQQYAKTVEYAYKNRSSYDMLNFIFTSASFNDAVKRVAYLKSYRKYREEQVESIYKTQEALKGRIDLLSRNKEEKGKVLDEQNRQKLILEEEKSEQASFVNKLKARENELMKEMAAKKKLDRNLQNAIAAIVRREIQAEQKRADDARKLAEARNKASGNAKPSTPSGSGTGTSNATAAPKPAPARKASELEGTPEVTRVSVGFENNRRNLPWPVDIASVISGFGRRNIEGTRIVEENVGITIETREGTPVKAVFEGVVASVMDVGGSPTVCIKHGKYFTTYFNLNGVSVTRGQEVRMGQVIGKAASNEDGVGEILFAVSIESTFVDPENWLKSR
jgi:septal ring factor EnvC (AmiA/AmiB activator)